MVKEIEIRTNEAEKQRRDVEAVKEAVAHDAAIVAAGKAEAQRDLEAAEPTLQEAIKSLESILLLLSVFSMPSPFSCTCP